MMDSSCRHHHYHGIMVKEKVETKMNLNSWKKMMINYLYQPPAMECLPWSLIDEFSSFRFLFFFVTHTHTVIDDLFVSFSKKNLKKNFQKKNKSPVARKMNEWMKCIRAGNGIKVDLTIFYLYSKCPHAHTHTHIHSFIAVQYVVYCDGQNHDHRMCVCILTQANFFQKRKKKFLRFREYQISFWACLKIFFFKFSLVQSVQIHSHWMFGI